MSLLEVKGLAAAYGLVPALHRVDFHVDDGEVVGILGHNGMGKTTLMRAIMGYVQLTAGDVLLQGRSIIGLPTNARARAGVCLVPQGREIFPNLTVAENLHVAVVATGGNVAATTEEVLQHFPRLKPLLDRRGGALSGGEQQLLALARCLCCKPRIMLLDEPTEGIQPSIIDEIIETLQQLIKASDLTIVLVEQNLDFVTSLSSRVYAIANGVLEHQIPGEQLTDARAVSEFMGFVA